MTSQNLRQRVKANPGCLKQSLKLMQAEKKSKRVKFDSWPDFVQHTLWHPELENFDASWRQHSIPDRLQIAEQLRQEGAEFYREGQWAEAAGKYEQAAGLFHYVRQTRNLQLDEIDDCYLQLVTDDGTASEDVASSNDSSMDGKEIEGAQRARSLRATCYANIAQCHLQLSNHLLAIRACDESLQLDPCNVKVLYRRALACEGIGDLTSLNDALQDLSKAEALEPSNSAVRQAKSRIRSASRQHREAEQKLFADCLGAGLGGSDERQQAAAAMSEAELAADAGGADLEQRIDEAVRLRGFYLAQGMDNDAREMEDAIDKLRCRLAERQKRGVDLLQPSEELVEEAKAFGINLKDPEERRKLDRMMWAVNRQKSDVQPSVMKSSCSALGSGFSRQSREILIFLLVVALALTWLWFLLRPLPTDDGVLNSTRDG